MAGRVRRRRPADHEHAPAGAIEPDRLREPPPPIEEQVEMTIDGVEAETADGTRERIERPTHVEWRHHDEDSHRRREAQHARSTARTRRSRVSSLVNRD